MTSFYFHRELGESKGYLVLFSCTISSALSLLCRMLIRLFYVRSVGMADLFHRVHGHFLARYGVYFDVDQTMSGASGEMCVAPILQALDIMLAEKYNVCLSEKLRAHLSAYSTDALLHFWEWFGQVWKEAGKAVRNEENMVAMFGDFPNNLPEDMDTLWVKRVLCLFSPLAGKCLSCGKQNTVITLEPCHHCVCTECFHGYTGCPVCGRPIDRDSLFLKGLETIYASDRKAWGAKQYIDFGEDIYKFAEEKFHIICGTAQALSSQDKETLDIILSEWPERVVSWLPDGFGSRQAMAVVLGALMKTLNDDVIIPALERYLNNATDVLRLIAVMSGEDGTLMPHRVNARICCNRSNGKECCTAMRVIQSYQFKVVKMPRRQRRMFLQILESFEENALKEDMLRRRALWARVGEFLHAGDYINRFPKVNRAFDVVHKKDISGMRVPAFRTWRSRLEQAIADRDTKQLEMLMAQRPGEFARHIDRILRGFVMEANASSYASGQVLNVKNKLLDSIKKRASIFETVKQIAGGIGESVTAAAGDVTSKLSFVQKLSKNLKRLSTPMLVQLWGHFRIREHKLDKRVFYPAGSSRKVYWILDKRFTINPVYTWMIRKAIEKELLGRFEKKTHFAQSVIDETIASLTFPFSERNSGSVAIHLSAGSSLPMPPEDSSGKLRLFLHWCQKAESRRVDLDLSVAFYDETWEKHGCCTYYQLVYPQKLNTLTSQHPQKCKGIFAQHSGDFQEAPYPRGATEYVDIDRKLALAAGFRYVIMLVNVFAGVDFNDLERAYTGVMYRNNLQKTAQFDPNTVRYKYALTGEVNSYIPLIFDLKEEKIVDVQCYPTARGRLCNLESNESTVRGVAQAMMAFYSMRPRTMRDDIALMQAAARSTQVWLRRNDGTALLFVRGEKENIGAFYSRLVHRKQSLPDDNHIASGAQMEGEYKSVPNFDAPTLAFLMDGDLPLADNSEYYIIFNGILSEKYAWTELLNV